MTKLFYLTCFFVLLVASPNWLSAQVDQQPGEGSSAVFGTVQGYSTTFWTQQDGVNGYSFEEASQDTIQAAHALAWGYFHMDQAIANATGTRLIPLFVELTLYRGTPDEDHNQLIEAEYTITYVEVDISNPVKNPGPTYLE